MTATNDQHPYQGEPEPIEELLQDVFDLVDETVAGITDDEVSDELHRMFEVQFTRCGDPARSRPIPDLKQLDVFTTSASMLTGREELPAVEIDSIDIQAAGHLAMAWAELQAEQQAAKRLIARAQEQMTEAETKLALANERLAQATAESDGVRRFVDKEIDRATKTVEEAKEQAARILAEAETRAESIVDAARQAAMAYEIGHGAAARLDLPEPCRCRWCARIDHWARSGEIERIMAECHATVASVRGRSTIDTTDEQGRPAAVLWYIDDLAASEHFLDSDKLEGTWTVSELSDKAEGFSKFYVELTSALMTIQLFCVRTENVGAHWSELTDDQVIVDEVRIPIAGFIHGPGRVNPSGTWPCDDASALATKRRFRELTRGVIEHHVVNVSQLQASKAITNSQAAGGSYEKPPAK